MEIIKTKCPTLEQKVQQNEDNIDILAQYIKEPYNTQETLTTESTTIDETEIVDFPEDAEKGFILSKDGLLFNIVGKSGSNVYIAYWATLPTGPQGPQGSTGPQGPQGPNALICTKIISSQGMVITTTITTSDFTRTPVVNEYCLAFLSDTTEGVNKNILQSLKSIALVIQQ